MRILAIKIERKGIGIGFKIGIGKGFSYFKVGIF